MSTNDANSILMGGGGAPSAKLTEGVTITGRILNISEPYQEREYDPTGAGNGKPKFFKNGNPIMTFYVDLATDLRDPMDADDDGTRRLYMDGSRIKKAVRAGIAAAGASGLQVGATLSITCTHYDTPGDVRSGKNYAVKYTPGSAANSVLMGQPAPAQTPTPAPAAAPAPVTTVAPAAPGAPNPDAIAALVAAGIDPSTVYPGHAA